MKVTQPGSVPGYSLGLGLIVFFQLLQAVVGEIKSPITGIPNSLGRAHLARLSNQIQKQNHTRVAIATQGSAITMSTVLNWVQFHSHNNHFVLLSYDEPIRDVACASSLVTCVFSPNSTWTTGRNKLAQTISRLEQENNHLFKFWYFIDGDLISTAECYELLPTCLLDEPKVSCCLKAQLGVLEISSAGKFAEVAFQIVNAHPGTWKNLACNDAATAAFHRLVVPLALPYDAFFDKESWWLSQQIHFVKTRACYPDFVVRANIVRAYKDYHSPYPRNKYPNATIAYLDEFGKTLGISHASQLHQGDCALSQRDGTPKAHVAFDQWIRTTQFGHCWDMLYGAFRDLTN